MRYALSLLLAATCTLANAYGVSGQGTWEATLKGRDLDGNTSNGFEAYYDTVLNITWLADANYAQTTGHTSAANGGVEPDSVYDSTIKWTDSRMGWDAAQSWATNLTVYGINGWRLPTVIGPRTTELQHLFYATMGNVIYDKTSAFYDYDATNTGPFKNVGGYYYWSDAVSHIDDSVVTFGPGTGFAPSWPKDFASHAWAVRSGDIAAVPEPESLALVGVGLAALIMRRRSC